ncbi:WcbI family polysaccharide biosynthesis putative acetyltransferase [Frigoribacterium sp. CFBP 8751]|uniref:WcbI family polysaccharide biosynthesis putative acetyltransferase n=1 Tax=Frigoribacterium sp. CFBP 8751 TaxID=2775277 RepID=UPI00177B39A9|nr:WcbI family polysaccharide biosynthesis putative acetyltransferase [Frigoribacterium sp. CFBP 8751]MBD8539748.1 peptide ABC transporter ATPase [Frigoribacterium sp. CFBP 8751]
MSEQRTEPDGRTRHYGDFYGLSEPEGDGAIALVVGNCQAESLRIFLDGAGLTAVRMPPVHELTAADLPQLERWLGRAGLLVSQPVRDDYHDLPLGTAQLAAMLPREARVVRVPVVRFAGLYPAHVIVRPPSDVSLVPPVVEYHDVRLIAEAAGRPLPADALRPAVVRSVAELSLAELRRREVAHDTVVASDLFEVGAGTEGAGTPRFDQMRTLNHPGNPVWTALASRVRDRLGLPEHVVDPGRPVLSSVHAPREQAVIDAWGLDAEPTDHWVVGGERVGADEVRRAHLAWYAEHPDAVEAALARHADTFALWGAA